jgi:hypothetical protein
MADKRFATNAGVKPASFLQILTADFFYGGMKVFVAR